MWPDDVPDLIADPSDELRVANHWVPRTHLRRFAEDGVLWMYRRDDPDSPVRVTPNNAAVENNLYVVGEDAPLEPRDAMERLLAYVEEPYGRIRQWLIRGPSVGLSQEPPEEYWERFSIFLAMQYLRTPYWRDFLRQTASFYAALHIRTELENLEYAHDRYGDAGENPISKEELRRVRDELDTGRIEIEPDESTWLGLFGKSALKNAGYIFNLPWRLIQAPEGVAFPTSDLPVALARVGSDGYQLGGGFLEPKTQVTFPLTPSHVLIMGAGVGARYVGSDQWCEAVARRMIHHSRRFVFSPREDPQIADVLRDTEPPRHVIAYGEEERSLDGPVGPVVKEIVDNRVEYLRVGPPGGPPLP